MRSLCLCVLALSLLVACDPELGDDDDGTPPLEDCPASDLFEATACGETYCGEARATVGTGTEGYEELTDGDEVPIWFGTQGGYHIDITLEMDRLCPIVFVKPYMYVVPPDGDRIEIFSDNRHLQAVRTDPSNSAIQQFWGIQGFVPCAWWPDDPDNDPDCSGGPGSEGHVEDFEVILRVEAYDHHWEADGETPIRVGSSERTVRPVCCGG